MLNFLFTIVINFRIYVQEYQSFIINKIYIYIYLEFPKNKFFEWLLLYSFNLERLVKQAVFPNLYGLILMFINFKSSHFIYEDDGKVINTVPFEIL